MIKQTVIFALSGAGEQLLLSLQDSDLHYRTYKQGLLHNENLAPLCDELFSTIGLVPQNLDAIAVDLGPGSFTGQRISLAFAKGLGFALEKPLLGLDTFSVWQHSSRLHYGSSCPVLVVIDGRKRRFYARLYLGDQIGGSWDLGSRDLCLAIEQQFGKEEHLAEAFGSSPPAKLYLNGPGAQVFLQELAGHELVLQNGAQMKRQASPCTQGELGGWQKFELCQVPSIEELALAMQELAQQKYRQGDFMRASEGPLYLRKSDAEEQGASSNPSRCLLDESILGHPG